MPGKHHRKAKQPKPLGKSEYKDLVAPMHLELVRMAEWLQAEGRRLVVLIEGRDTAGKGGTAKAIAEHLNPRQCRTVPCHAPPSANRPSGTSSATSRTCLRPAKWCCSIAAGTTAPGWNG